MYRSCGPCRYEAGRGGTRAVSIMIGDHVVVVLLTPVTDGHNTMERACQAVDASGESIVAGAWPDVVLLRSLNPLACRRRAGGPPPPPVRLVMAHSATRPENSTRGGCSGRCDEWR